MIAAVIPAYNESKRLGDVIKKTKKFVNRVIVVDDGSKDNTFDVAKKNADIVLRNVVNMGKGFALKAGFEEAVRERADAIVMLDADGQHDPAEIPKLLAGLKKSDFVVGVRDFSKMPFRARFANNILTLIFRVLFFMNAGDSQSGFRAVKTRIYSRIKWKSNSYGVETEMLANAAKKKIAYSEVPIKTIYHEIYKGTGVTDGIKILLLMIRWRLFPW